jgi:hypothetical protein
MPSTCRNLLGLSNNYTCYVVKKSFLRVIHTSLSVKCLLRGHSSHILDLKFSSVSNDIMCSVDDDISDVECPHTFIWQLLPTEGDLTSKKLLELQIGAQTCQPHPQIPYVWALSNKNKIGIISSQFSGMSYSNYSDLPMNAVVDGTVMDILFTSNGQYLVVTVRDNSGKTHIDVWKLPTVDLLIKGEGSLFKVALTYPSIVPDILSSIIASCGYVIASNDPNNSSNNNSINILISVWPLEVIFGKNVDEQLMKPSQSLLITLPHQNSNNINSQNEVSISYSSSESSDSNILVISHKSSQIIICLAINNNKVYPMAHVSMLDLTWPVSFFGTTIVSGQYDHDKEKELLEICCYQEGEKAAVQQYHVPCEMLSTMNAVSSSIPTVSVSSLELPSVPVSPSQYSTSPNRSILSILQDSSIQKSANEQEVTSSSENVITTPKSVHESPIPIRSVTNVTPSPTVQINTSPTVQINTSIPAGSRSILNMLLSPQQSKPELELETKKDIISTPKLVDSSAQVPIIAPLTRESVPVASSPSNLSDIPDFLQAAPVGNKSILSMINGKKKTSTPVVTPTISSESTPIISPKESPNISPVTTTVEQSQGRSILSFLTEKNPQLPPIVSANVPAVVISSIDSVDSENDDDELSESASEDEQIVAELEIIDKEESSDEDWNAASDSAEVEELNTSTQMKNDQNKKLNKNNFSSDTDLSSIILSLTDIKEMTAKIQREYVTKDSINLLKADIERGIVKNCGDQTHQAIKNLIKVETKSAVESVISTKEWKNAMISQISSSIQSDIAPIIATRVNTAVKDTVKASLTSTFRGAFENSLLPAFQAGTDRMFAQVQEAVDTGMEGLIEQGRISQQISTDATVELQEEVKSLKSTVSSLELMVENLIKSNNESNLKLENMVIELSKSSSNNQSQSNSENNDPISLLEKGLISEAVECALEKKDIHILVKLLEKITPTQMSTKCNSISQLCAAQQLAFNLASSDPEDGYSKRLSWLKSLIMGLLFAPKDPNTSDHIQPLLRGIYSYLMTASVRLTQKLAEGVENHESDEIASTITDIKMLTAIVSTKI